MENFNKQKWEDLNLSRDEVKNIGQALKNEEFRGLLADYVKEINDPENRRQYEEEITQLENERGVHVKFIHPTSGYVIKTSVNGKSKAFINICTNINVGVPFSNSEYGGQQRIHWSVPYCLAPPREDLDKKKKLCLVYDVVFHPDTLALSKNNAQFKKLVHDTALEGIEQNFNVALDKVNLKFSKMKFKGLKHATVIRKKIESFQVSECTEIPNYPYPPLREDIQDVKGSLETNRNINLKGHINKDSEFTTPNFTIKHRSTIDMENFTNDPLSKMSATVPKELVVTIDLPLLKCSSDASVDVTENVLALLSEKPAKYKLDLKLPYSVDKTKGCAQFVMSKKSLTVTLPVVSEGKNIIGNVDLSREDSGVESDNGNGRSDSTSSNEENDWDKFSTMNGVHLSNQNESQNRREKSNEAIEDFLKPNLHYAMPNYICKYADDILTITLQVPNVNPESVEFRFLNECSGFHMAFVSIGAGFFPVNYAFCFMLPSPNKIDNNTFSFKVLDNNITAQIKSPSVRIDDYYVGTDEKNSRKEFLPKFAHETEQKTITKELSEVNDNTCNEKEYCEQSGPKNENEKAVVGAKITKQIYCLDEKQNAKSEDGDDNKSQGEEQAICEISDVKNKNTVEQLKENPDFSEGTSSFDEERSVSPERQPAKLRTVSESHHGEVERNKYRGILKIGRSLSESSVDDYASWSVDKMEKTKKTVRFSDVISKQIFRSNSSILGQRKKNQRKTRNKKRAQERRLSESGNESEGDAECSELKVQNKDKKDDIWLNNAESSSCEVSEVSDVSDISESDDGQKENGPPIMPCSSRKNHKRRGKKSARKNASTAKFNYMEY